MLLQLEFVEFVFVFLPRPSRGMFLGEEVIWILGVALLGLFLKCGFCIVESGVVFLCVCCPCYGGFGVALVVCNLVEDYLIAAVGAGHDCSLV